MSKFSNLKTYNIMIFALIPILFIAMVATVTLAAMTDTEEGKNTITITGMGPVTASITTTTGLYPGGDFVGAISLAYARGNGYDASSITVSNFEITSVTANLSNSKTQPVSVSTETNTFDYITGNYTFTPSGADTNDLANGGTLSITAGTPQTVNLKFTLKDGSSTNGTPATALLNCVKSLTINYTFTVSTS